MSSFQMSHDSVGVKGSTPSLDKLLFFIAERLEAVLGEKDGRGQLRHIDLCDFLEYRYASDEEQRSLLFSRRFYIFLFLYSHATLSLLLHASSTAVTHAFVFLFEVVTPPISTVWVSCAKRSWARRAGHPGSPAARCHLLRSFSLVHRQPNTSFFSAT
jgi:hypothetical protein